MRVENPGRGQAEGSKTQSFKAALNKAKVPHPAPHSAAAGPKPQPKPGPGKAPSPLAHPAEARALATAHHAAQKLDAALTRSQRSASAFSHELVQRRTEAELHRPELKQVAQKLAGILAGVDARPREEGQAPQREPERERSPERAAAQPAQGVPADVPPPQPVQPSPPPARVEALAGQIETLLERAELLAKAEGPALQLGLSEGRAAQIEVVRTGKGEVTLRLQARSPADRRALAGQVKAIKASLAERGLHVREVRVA